MSNDEGGEGRPNIQHGMSNAEGGEERPNIQHGMSKEDEGEGGTLNAERRTLNAEVGRHGEEGSRLVAPDVRAGTGVEVVQAAIEVEKADLGATPWERKLVEKLRVGQKRAVWRSCTRDLVRPARRAWAGCPCHVVPAATLLRPLSSGSG